MKSERQFVSLVREFDDVNFKIAIVRSDQSESVTLALETSSEFGVPTSRQLSKTGAGKAPIRWLFM